MPKTPAGQTRAQIHRFVVTRILQGEPPSVREVQAAFGFRSSATARQHLDALVEAGLLEQRAGQDRGYRVPGAPQATLVPLLGQVQAGALNTALELVDAYVPVEEGRAEGCFALTVRGESMAGREIHDGDVLLVQRNQPPRDGDIVVALLGDEATVKTFRKRGEEIVLQAENPAYADILPAESDEAFSILGRVCEVRRQL